MKARASQLPRHDGLFWPVVQALQSLDGSADNDQLVERVSDILGLPDDLTAIPHKDGPQTEISYRIAWVKTWLKWGLIVNNPKRAVWVLTERGRNATEQEIEKLRLELRSNPSMRKIAPGTLPRETFSDRPSEPDELGSGLIDHIQKMTIAAITIADMKVWAQRS